MERLQNIFRKICQFLLSNIFCFPQNTTEGNIQITKMRRLSNKTVYCSKNNSRSYNHNHNIMVGFSSCLDLLMDGRVIFSKTSYLFDLKTASFLILTVLFFETKFFKLAKRSWSLLDQKNDFCDNFTVNRLGFGVNDILPEKLVGII